MSEDIPDWNDCGNVQCAQVHHLLDSMLETFDVFGPRNRYVIGKSAHYFRLLNEKITGLESEVSNLRAECAELKQADKEHLAAHQSALVRAREAGARSAFEFVAEHLGCSDREYAVRTWMTGFRSRKGAA